MAVSEHNEIAGHLSTLHAHLIDLFSSYKDEELRTQHHPDLSQLGWHLNHIAFIEQYWLREVVLGDESRTKDLHQDYFPELIDKAERGSLTRITDFSQLKAGFSDTEALWTELASERHQHPLLKNNYIGWFLLQHGQQHLETMMMILQERALKTEADDRFTARKFDALAADLPDIVIPGGDFEVGSNSSLACDNEQPVHIESLPAFWIAETAVSNAEYLGFMQAGGYRIREYWTDEGWLWKTESRTGAPQSWRRDHSGNWYKVSLTGPCNIDAKEAVSGINWYEADAFARYAACRLPHEFEWEAAMKADTALLGSTGQAWEWCSNTFFPYTGFHAFPYERYSTPWFDNHHYTLKGSSPHTGECARRPSFRNFYQPDKRHIFAGLRLACDSG